MIKNKIFESKFISRSKIPNFVRAVLEPIEILVYLPTYITNPITVPFVKTVLVHMVFYNVNLYLTSPYIKTPEKLYI
jgi:hypothetical protein